MNIIKRDGREVQFDKQKIYNAIFKANLELEEDKRIDDEDIAQITGTIVQDIKEKNYTLNVEEIQEIVEDNLMDWSARDVAKKYIRYRYKRNLERGHNAGLYDTVLTLVNNNNEEIKQENSNKNPVINSTQRDYIAGELSKAISRDRLLPKDIWEAHQAGIIHFHDLDYFVQPMTNCCLINLEDMLQNGTCISDTLIERPKSFATACTVTSQIVAQVASNQFGGQSWSLTHLAPFVQVSREKIYNKKKQEWDDLGFKYTLNELKDAVEKELRIEIKSGIQTINYQLLTLLTTNGQTPFVTIFMYINEVPEGQLRNDLVMLIQEVLEQRYTGIKNSQGVLVTPAFPKLIYVLQENNITPGSEYYWLTELAAKCSAKRLVPDYISEKMALELKGDVYTCMGCRSFLTPDRFTDAGLGNMANAKNYVPGKHKYYGRLTIITTLGIRTTLNGVNAMASAV